MSTYPLVILSEISADTTNIFSKPINLDATYLGLWQRRWGSLQYVGPSADIYIGFYPSVIGKIAKGSSLVKEDFGGLVFVYKKYPSERKFMVHDQCYQIGYFPVQDNGTFLIKFTVKYDVIEEFIKHITTQSAVIQNPPLSYKAEYDILPSSNAAAAVQAWNDSVNAHLKKYFSRFFSVSEISAGREERSFDVDFTNIDINHIKPIAKDMWEKLSWAGIEWIKYSWGGTSARKRSNKNRRRRQKRLTRR